MNISVVYVYAPVAGLQYERYAERFLHSYHANPPALEHESVVVLNGCKENAELHCLFSTLPNLRFLQHDNSGYDIGGFQKAAREVACDMIVFFGASTFFYRPGWLLRMATSFQNHGNAQYGAMGNRGDATVKVWPHIRTTAFWMDPKLMAAYPHRVTQPQQRHPFEHGPNCFSEWVKRQGLKNWVVTFNKELLWKEWDSDPNGFQNGNQSSLLAGDHICERPYYPNNTCQHPAPGLDPYCHPWRSERCWPCLTQPA